MRYDSSSTQLRDDGIRELDRLRLDGLRCGTDRHAKLDGEVMRSGPHHQFGVVAPVGVEERCVADS